MAQLESETKARLRPLLAKHGLQFEEKVNADLVGQIASSYVGAPWQKFIGEQHGIVSSFVERFEQIEQVTPAEDMGIVHSMVLHERAILKFIELEAAGRARGSINNVVAQLHFPLPNPRGF